MTSTTSSTRVTTDTPVGTRIRVGTNPTTYDGGYVMASFGGAEVTLAERWRGHGDVRVALPSGVENVIGPAHLSVIGEESAEETMPHADRVGRLTIVRTPDTERHVWFYVVAALPDGKVYGVNLGTNSSYVSPDGDGFRFQTAEPDGTTNDPISRLGAPVRDELASFFRRTSPHLAAIVAGSGEGETTEDAYARGKRDQRAEDVSEFERWKESATATAHDYANRNGLCGEFDRCMEEIGLRPREREYDVEVTVSYSTTVTITAAGPDNAEELVTDDPWAYIDLTYGVKEYADVTIGEVEIA